MLWLSTPRSAILFIAMLGCLAVPASAQNSYFSATGTLQLDGTFSYAFDLADPEPAFTEFRTWAFEGGTNAAGDVIPAGGVDSYIEVQDSTSQVLGWNDDRGGSGRLDSRLTPFGTNPVPHTYLPPLGAGGYLFLTNVLPGNTYGNSSFAADMTREGTFTLSTIGMSAGSISSMKFGADVERGAIVQPAGGVDVAGTIEVQGGGVLESAGTIRTRKLSFTGDGKLDLKTHALIVDYTGTSPLDALRLSLKSGYNDGAWDGSGILTSSASSASFIASIGYAENTYLDIEAIEGYEADESSVILNYTLAGDANLDFQVDAQDLSVLASHWQQSGSWIGGDFNYDGLVDIRDLYMMAVNWNLSLVASTALPLPGGDFASAMAQLGFPAAVAVPEPAMLGLLVMAGPSLLLQRRNRRPRS